MAIAQYDQPFPTNYPTFRGSPQENYQQAVTGGAFMPGERRKIDALFIHGIMRALKFGSAEAAQAVLVRLKGLLDADGYAQMDQPFFERIMEASGALAAIDACGPWVSRGKPLDRACCLACLGSFEESLEAFNVAVQQGTDVRAHLGRGRLLLESKQFQQAADDFSRYLAFGERFRRASGQAWLAEAEFALGAKDATLTHLRAALNALAALPAKRPAWADIMAEPGIECWLGYGTEPLPGRGTQGSPGAWLIPDLRELIDAIKQADGCGEWTAEERAAIDAIKQDVLALRVRLGV